MWVKTDKSPTLGPFTENPQVKQTPSDLTNISELFFIDSFCEISCEETYNSKINNPMVVHPIEGEGLLLTSSLSSVCLQTEMNDPPASLGVTYGWRVAPPAIVGFLEWDYSDFPNFS